MSLTESHAFSAPAPAPAPAPRLAIVGASGHALVVAEAVVLEGQYDLVGFIEAIDASRWGASLAERPILGGWDRLESLRSQGVQYAMAAMGDNRVRLEAAERLVAAGFLLATAVHPRAFVSPSARVGPGTVVLAGAVVAAGAQVGANVIVNTCASVDHECVIEDGVHIGPGARLGGRARMERASWLAIGAVAIDRITIGAGAIVGAGAVAVRNVPPRMVAYGVPARMIREVEDRNH